MESLYGSGPSSAGRPPALTPAVPELTARFAALWNEAGEGRPDLGPAWTRRERRPREKALARFVEALQKEAERPPLTPEDGETCRARIFGAFEAFARSGLGWRERQLDALLRGGFDRGAAEFVRTAREFDPGLRPGDVFQACRNVWVANGLQMLLGLPVRLTRAVFAYSMLYPYTDNALDDPSVGEEDKRAFLGRLRGRLEGRAARPAGPGEQKVFELVAMIEEEWARARFPQVFESLIAIHEAQARSLRLLSVAGPPGESEIVDIALEKGGTSVLADGCLVAGSLRPEEVEFLFGFGGFLQLMDDLEDVFEDHEAGLWTVFSGAARRGCLDEVTNRLLRFGGRVLNGLPAFGVPGADPLREIIRPSLLQGVVTSAGRARRLYSRRYRKELETRSPFRFSFADRERRKLERRRALLGRLFESLSAVRPDKPRPEAGTSSSGPPRT